MGLFPLRTSLKFKQSFAELKNYKWGFKEPNIETGEIKSCNSQLILEGCLVEVQWHCCIPNMHLPVQAKISENTCYAMLPFHLLFTFFSVWIAFLSSFVVPVISRRDIFHIVSLLLTESMYVTNIIFFSEAWIKEAGLPFFCGGVVVEDISFFIHNVTRG